MAISPAAIRGSSSACSSSSRASQEGSARGDRRGQQGSGREVVAELLEDDGRLDERGPEAVVLLGDRQRSHADLLAHRLPQRLVVPALGLHRGAHGPLSLRLSSSDRDDRGELVLLLGAGEVHQPASRRASRRPGRGGTTRRPTPRRGPGPG